MADSIVSMAKDLVMELIKQNLIAPEDMTKELQKTHASLLELKARELPNGIDKAVNSERAAAKAVDWKQSTKKYTAECLVCGATFKQLSVRHVSRHGLDQRTYREKFGIPRTQPLSAKGYQRKAGHSITQRVRGKTAKAPASGGFYVSMVLPNCPGLSGYPG